MKLHFIPGRAFSYPSGGSRKPNMRTFFPLGNVSLCEFGRNRPGTSNPDEVTCATCRKRMLAGRFDTPEVVVEVTSRGGCEPVLPPLEESK